MEFKKYHSIENSYRTKFMDKIIEEGFENLTYSVYEKIHGANFAFYINEKEIVCAKRTAFLKDGDSFFNYEKVYDKYEKKLRSYFNAAQKACGIEQLEVCCELYGGSYPHKDVKKENVSAVQKGVFYNPDQDILVFDIKYDGFYLETKGVENDCEAHGIPYLKPLFTGTLKECLAYSNEFQTTIPATLGLPEIEGNICEGVVIKPHHPEFLWDRTRLIIKNKNESFNEKSGGTGPTKTPCGDVILPFHVLGAMSVAETYITENRLRNVLSKFGGVTTKDFGKVVGLFSKDVVEDFLKENEKFKEFGKSDRKLVTKRIGQKTALLLRTNFINIIDGEF